MDKFEVFRKAEEYAVELTNTQLFQDLLKVKKKINEELSELVSDFKDKRDKYESNKQYELYNDSIKKLQLEFQKVKEELYSKEIVQQYFKLEREIQSELNIVAKTLAKTISDKFK